MKYLTSRIVYSVILYTLIMILIYVSKPKLMFNENGSIKSYGIKKNETIYSLGVVSVILSVISFYFFCIIDLIFN